MVAFGNASGYVDTIDVKKHINAKGLFFTRPSIAHYTIEREELLESAKKVFDAVLDGKFKIEISKKYDGLYEINKSEMPEDIQSMIDNKEIGAALLRLIEVIGSENIEDIDDDTVYFIINTLNQLNVDLIRNKLLLKVLPLKV